MLFFSSVSLSRKSSSSLCRDMLRCGCAVALRRSFCALLKKSFTLAFKPKLRGKLLKFGSCRRVEAPPRAVPERVIATSCSLRPMPASTFAAICFSILPYVSAAAAASFLISSDTVTRSITVSLVNEPRCCIRGPTRL